MIRPTEKTLLAEIQKRLRLLSEKEESIDCVDNEKAKFISSLVQYEKQGMLDIHGMVMWYARQGAQESINGWTPLKDINGMPLCIGDKVKTLAGISGERCGTLEWDEYRKQYYLRSAEGGSLQIGTLKLQKIEELFKFSVDTTKTECRSRPNKKKW